MPFSSKLALLGATALVALCPLTPATAQDAQPWADTTLSPDARADLVVKAMTQAEKIQLVFGYFSTDLADHDFVHPADGQPAAAGYIAGIARLGIPAQSETDAGVGVATQRTPTPRLRTSLPAGIATAATWDTSLAYAGGAMIGNEARLSGFNVQLAGGVNLMRDPRNGRNFEYGGEDPLLAGLMVGNEIKGIQSNHIISTVKHFAFNNQETNRNFIDARIDDAAARESDLLAFQMAIETGQPGSVMCSYNRINGDYACENNWLLNQVLKLDWGYNGYVMSDWGATHSTVPAANAGLDQQSGWPFDKSPYFKDALGEAVDNGHVSEARFDDMAHRILRSMFANGLFDQPIDGDQSATIDYAGHAQVTQQDAEGGIVLLKNTGILPLARSARTILIVGGHADKGVLSGGGSSQVYPVGGLAVPDTYPAHFPGPIAYDPSSPMQGIAARTQAMVTYDDGSDPQVTASLAKKADVVIVFATRWEAESVDVTTLNLPDNQDALIDAVTAANTRTVVVLETGGPVAMPWLAKAGAVLEAWYPGTSGGEAIARVLTGEVDPSGHLPVTFAASLDQLPRPKLDGDPAVQGGHPHVDYDIEGAAVGYKWFDKKGFKPLFPFGYGLSYTTFAYDGLTAAADGPSVKVTFVLKNTGSMAGKAVAQVYVAPVAGGWEAPKRLGAFTKLDLAPSQSQSVSLDVDPRLLATFDSASKTWRIAAGDYKVMLGTSATDMVQTATLHLDGATLDVRGQLSR